MIAAPPSPATDLAKPCENWFVFLGEAGGGNPTAADIVETLVPLRIVRTVNSPVPMQAEFRFDLAIAEDRLQDIAVLESWNRIVQIWSGADVNNLEHCLFWGELSRQTLALSPAGEFCTISAAVNPYHFGTPLLGPQVWDQVAGAAADLDVEVVFNPKIDGVVEPNRAVHTVNVGTILAPILEETNYWLDPGSVKTESSLEWADVDVESWTLTTAVGKLLDYLNPDEQFILGLTDDELTEIFEEAPTIEDVRLPTGEYLPTLLSTLLEPHGYFWGVTIDQPDNDPANAWPKLTITRRGTGPGRQVFLQRPGEELDLAATNATDLYLDHDIAGLANVIVGYGSFIERQVTVELYRGWPEAWDNSPQDLENITDASRIRAWRFWVGNEAGDYNNLRSSVAPIGDGPLPLVDVFGDGNYVPRRRPMMDTLYIDVDTGDRYSAILEYYEPTEDEWKPCPPRWGGRILTDQLGVEFTAEAPPDELIRLGDEARVRITGVLRGDKRLTARVERDPHSPNSRDVVLYLDLGDRFHDRQFQLTGDLASVGTPIDPDVSDDYYTADDTEALEEFIEKVDTLEKAAATTLQLRLHDLHFEYQLGDLIEKLDGRELDFNRYSSTSAEQRYPQIVSLIYDRQEMTTEIVVENNDMQTMQNIVDAEHGLLPIEPPPAVPRKEQPRRDWKSLGNV